MWSKIRTWILGRYLKVINSIAFFPAFIALLFLVTASLVITFDYSGPGQELKSWLHWLTLKDPSTARSIISAIAAGVISLAVFSFSMVMIVLNQAASQMSNRVLDKLIGNRFQQVVLGVYIGTIVYALFLLSTIRDIDSGVYIPALSTYLLIALTIFDIFLFIYFLHYITQSVKYEVIIERIFEETLASLKRTCCLNKEKAVTKPLNNDYLVLAPKTGIYENFDKSSLVKLCEDNDCIVNMIHYQGTFILKGLPVLRINKELPDKVVTDILHTIYFPKSESIETNFFYGFRQLMEVALKALSPGINDPGTAIVSMRALFELLAYRACFFPDNSIKDKDENVRIITNELTFDYLFRNTVFPIWDYGKNDRMIRQEMFHLLTQLQSISSNAAVSKMLQEVSLKD